MAVFLPDYTFSGVVAATTTTLPTIDCQGFSYGHIFVYSNSDFHVDQLWSADLGINIDLIDLSGVQASGTTYSAAFTIKSRYFALRISEDVPVGGSTYRYTCYLNGKASIQTEAIIYDLEQVLTTGNTTNGLDIDITGGSCIKSTGADMCVSVNSGIGNLNLEGNLVVQGDISSIDYETLSVADSSILLNSGYTTTVGKSAFVVNNYLPTANTALVNGPFVAGVAGVSNPTIVTDNGYAWVVGDIVQTTGCNLEENDALYEVQSYLNPTLTLKGVGLNANTYSFFSSNVTADTVVAGTLTLMTVSALQNTTAGVWQYSNTSTNTTSLTFSSLVTTACWGMMVLTGTTKVSPSIGVFYEISGILSFSDVSGFTANANGRLTYTGSPTVRVMVNYSCHDQSLNEPVNEYTIRKNGVVSSFSSITRYEFQSIASVVVTGTFELSTNDYVSVWHDSTKTGNIETNYYKLQVFTI